MAVNHGRGLKRRNIIFPLHPRERRHLFRELLSRHGKGLALFLFGIVKNFDDAEELMLDAFARLSLAGKNFEGRSSLKTYLFAIGRNLALKHVRRKKIAQLLSLDEIRQELPVFDSSELDFARDEKRRELFSALRELPEDYRQVLMLLYFEDMSYKDAMLVMKKSEKQITNLAHRGRSALKRLLEQRGFDYEDY